MKLIRSTIVCLAGLGFAACGHDGPLAVTGGPLTVTGAPSRSLSLALGDELVLQIGGVGPGYGYPTINGSAISFLGETYPTPATLTPGGTVQLFHFRGLQSGQAVVLFHNPVGSASVFPDVIDTIVVR
jgi:hypothetical protein